MQATLRLNKDHIAITFRFPYFYVITLLGSIVVIVWKSGTYNCELSIVFVSTVITTTAYLLERVSLWWRKHASTTKQRPGNSV